MTEPRQLAVVREYGELMTALRNRANALDVPREAIDALAGLQSGYTAKLLAPVPIRAIGPTSLGPLLQALGVAIIIVEDLATFEKIEARLRKRRRKDEYATDGMLAHKRPKKRGVWRGNSEWGKVMGSRALLKMSPSDLRRRAKKAANARWSRQRRLKKLARVGISPIPDIID